MGSEISPPVFLMCADGDILAFDSAPALTSYTESIDVENGEYKCAFDGEGTPMQLHVARPSVVSKSVFGVRSVELAPVVLTVGKASPETREHLRQQLIRALNLNGLTSASLEDVVGRASTQFRRV